MANHGKQKTSKESTQSSTKKKEISQVERINSKASHSSGKRQSEKRKDLHPEEISAVSDKKAIEKETVTAKKASQTSKNTPPKNPASSKVVAPAGTGTSSAKKSSSAGTGTSSVKKSSSGEIGKVVTPETDSKVSSKPENSKAPASSLRDRIPGITPSDASDTIASQHKKESLEESDSEVEKSQEKSRVTSRARLSASEKRSERPHASSEGKRPSASKMRKAAPSPSEKRKKFAIPAAVAAVVALVIIVGCGMLFGQEGQQVEDEGAFQMALPVGEDLAQPAEPTPKNPIDFDSWQARNSHVHGWVNVPGTKVDYPLLQDPDAKDYYLWASVDREYSNDGEVYCQPVNGIDFSDPVILYYGHTFTTKDTMFTTLHYFHDKTFFDEHPYFYIYAPGRILTYEIVSVYEYPNKLVFNQYDFSDLNDLQEYFDFVLDPSSQNPDVLHVREHDRLVAGEDRVLQLVTCTEPANNGKRFMVTGVLSEETQTEGFEGDEESAAGEVQAESVEA